MKKSDRDFKSLIWPSFTDSMIVNLSIFIFLFIIVSIVNYESSKNIYKSNQELTSQKNELEKYKKENEALKKLSSDFGRELHEKAPEIIKIDRDGKAFISGDFLFPTLEDQLTINGVSAIKKLSPKLIELFKKIQNDKLKSGNKTFMLQISGYTDNDPIKSHPKFKDNWDLSSSRASNVVRELQKNGFPAKNMFTSGFSQYQPINSNKNSTEKEKNRRINIDITTITVKK